MFKNLTNPNLKKRILLFAGASNIIFGLLFAFYPNFIFAIAEMPQINYPLIWQGASTMICIYGFGYLIASTEPNKYWPIIFMGFMVKSIGTFAFFYYGYLGLITFKLECILVLNNIVWVLPFGYILHGVYQEFIQEEEDFIMTRSYEQNLIIFETQYGSNLYDLSFEKPLMLVFLRHFGCTFCKEALSDLSKQRKAIDQQRLKVVVVHMTEDEQALAHLKQYNLDDLDRVSDTECELYRSFGLRRGKFSQIFGLKSWFRAIVIGFRSGHLVSALAGDGFRMPGTFTIQDGKIISAYHYKSVADRPHYATIANYCQKQVIKT